MTDYEELKILECNNLSSSQYRGVNQDSPAIFTNKLGSSIELKRGDKVGVEYAMINEKGCGLSQAMEVKGIELKDSKNDVIKKTFLKSVVTQVGEVSLGVQQGLTNYVAETIELTPVEKILRDDEVNIEIQYYKNINGEGYELLPRRFNCEDQKKFSHSDPAKPISTLALEANKIWDLPDTIATGKVHYPQATTTYVGPPIVPQDEVSICLDDYILFMDEHNSTNYNGVEGYYKLATDGGRYTILARDSTIFYPTTWGGIDYEAQYDDLDKLEHIGNYHIYTELLELKVDKGFNSPEYIARQLTEQLQEAEDPVLVGVDDTGKEPHYHPFTSFTNTNTYKAMNCAWNGGHKESNFNDYHNAAPTFEEKVSGVNYQVCYEYIGCKRPEIFIAGRECNSWSHLPNPMYIRNTIVGSPNNTTDHIVTNWVWESDELVEPQLKKLSALFAAQYKYPELFEGNDNFFGVDEVPVKNRENCRFLHVNRYTNIVGNIDSRLGYDNIEDKGAARQSMPVFFKFDPNYDGIMTNGWDINKLAYGFATKTLVGSSYYITLHPELVGGIESYLFSYQAATTIVGDTTMIGWDWHFSAYSTCCCLLYSGYQKYSHDGLTQPGDENLEKVVTPPTKSCFNVSGFLNKTYIGSNNAAVTYSNNHFQWVSLHTAENIGQDFNAGSTNESGDNPIIEDAGQECYKINKRLQYWTWCPDMRPYNLEESVLNNMVKPVMAPGSVEPGQITLTNTIGQKIKPLNRAITPFSICDAHCGIFMNLGKSFDKTNWREGLLGILGFTYEQFNPTTIDDKNNRLARVQYNNIYNLESLTTNSQITTTESKNYIMNRYDAIMYSTQVPAPVAIPGWGQPSAPNYVWDEYFTYGMYPTIVEQTESIQINTQELPRTMLRSYYSIRSDLILQENNKYMGGGDSGDRLPVIAVINKENGDGDFYFSGSDLQFTITQDMNISSVTTSIHDPDGTLANLNSGSGVIYKIVRMKSLDNSIVQEILGNNMDSKKKNKK